jgi:hypothetical protein
MEWIQLAQWQATVNTVMNIPVSKRCGNSSLIKDLNIFLGIYCKIQYSSAKSVYGKSYKYTHNIPVFDFEKITSIIRTPICHEKHFLLSHGPSTIYLMSVQFSAQCVHLQQAVCIHETPSQWIFLFLHPLTLSTILLRIIYYIFLYLQPVSCCTVLALLCTC